MVFHIFMTKNITDKNDYTEGIRSKIGQVRTLFNKIHKLLCSKDLSLTLKIRMSRYYVFLVLLHGMESLDTE